MSQNKSKARPFPSIALSSKDGFDFLTEQAHPVTVGRESRGSELAMSKGGSMSPQVGRARGVLALGLGLCLALSLLPATAQAAPFGVGSLIIPRDECYQRGDYWKPDDAYCGFSVRPSYLPAYDSTFLTNAQVKDIGVMRAYGLAWFLMANGVKIYTVINKTKMNAPGCPTTTLAANSGDEIPPSEGKIDGRDFCIDGGAGVAPVKLVDKTTPGGTTNIFEPGTLNAGSNVISYRGSPLIIAAADAPKALSLIATGTYSAGGINTPSPVPWGVNDAAGVTAIPGNGFRDVDIHVAQVSFNAPVLNWSSTVPKPLAVGDSDRSDILVAYLYSSGLAYWINGGAGKDYGCAPGYVPDGIPGCTGHGLVWDIVTNAAINAGELLTGGYRVLWYPHYDGFGNKRFNSGNNNVAADDAQVWGAKIRQFVDAGNSFVGACASILTMENIGPGNSAYLSACNTYETGNGSSCVDNGRHTSTTGIYRNWATRPWGKTPATQTFAHQDVGHPFVQYGNSLYWVEGGTVTNWRNIAGKNTSKPGSIRLITMVDPAGDGALLNPRWDTATSSWINGDDGNDDYETAMIRYKDNDAANNKGLIVYYGAHAFDNNDGSQIAGTRLFMNTIFQIEALTIPTFKEVTRSSPVTKADPGNLSEAGTYIYQGSWVDLQPPPDHPVFVWSPTPAFDFPATAGHLRVYDQSQLSTTRKDFDAVAGASVHWDGYNQVLENAPTDCAIPTSTTSCLNSLPVDNNSALQRRVIFTAQLGSSSGTDANYLSRVAFTKSAYAGNAFDVCGADGAFTKAPTAETNLLINKVRAGKLGGIDRSNLAYVPGTDTVASSSSCLAHDAFLSSCRPVMVYAGALDGMLHGFSTADVENSGPGAAGWDGFHQLWSFIPPDQLSRLRDNTARVNSSPVAVDIQADFYDSSNNPGQDGSKEWKTILFSTTAARDPGEDAFYHDTTDYHCGNGGTSPTNSRTDYHEQQGRGTVWAIDVSDPRAPKPLWAASPATMGASAGVSVAAVNCQGAPSSMVFVVTKIPGAAAAPGFNAYGLDAATGSKVWERNFTYTMVPQKPGVSANVIIGAPLPIETKVAPVSSGLDVDPATGCAAFLYIGDAEGKIWQLNPLDGTDIGPATSLAPPAVPATGPYWDVANSSNTSANCNSTTQIKCPISVLRPAYDGAGALHLVAVVGGFDFASGGQSTLLVNIDTQNFLSGGAPKNPKVTDLGPERVYGDPIVYGDDVYLTTSESDVNAIGGYGTAGGAGKVMKISLSSGLSSVLAVSEAGMGSASKLAIGQGGKVIATGAQGIKKVDNTANNGNKPLTAADAPPKYRLWLQNFQR